MRIVVFFVLNICITYCIMWSAIITGNDMGTRFLITLGLWGIFFYYASRRQRRMRLKRENDAMLNMYLRDRIRRW